MKYEIKLTVANHGQIQFYKHHATIVLESSLDRKSFTNQIVRKLKAS